MTMMMMKNMLQRGRVNSHSALFVLASVGLNTTRSAVTLCRFSL